MLKEEELSHLSDEEFQGLKNIVCKEALRRYEADTSRRPHFGPFKGVLERDKYGNMKITDDYNEYSREHALAEDIIDHLQKYFGQWFTEGFALKIKVERKPTVGPFGYNLSLSTRIEWEGKIDETKTSGVR